MSDFNNPMVKMRYTENNPYIYIEQLRAENERLKTALAEAEKREKHHMEVSQKYEDRYFSEKQRAEAAESRLRDAEMCEAVLVEAVKWIDESFNGRHRSPHLHMLEVANKASSTLANISARTSAYNEVIEAAREQDKENRAKGDNRLGFLCACERTHKAIRKLDGEVK